jgi:DNA-binding transcriptional ArsR family regulator
MRNRPVTYSTEAVFEALADPTRRALLDLLRGGCKQAGQIADAFPVSRPAISKHLRRLHRAQLVREHREGRNRVYQLNPEPLRVVDSWLDRYRSFWTINLTNLKSFVEAEQTKEIRQSSGAKSTTKKGARQRETLKIAALIFILSFWPKSFVMAETPAAAAFGRLKTLVGTWTGANSAGNPLTVSFRETSAGSALLDEVHVAGPSEEDMISMFHLDRDRLLLTHYCAAGNQPRMAGHASPDGRTITFDFFDATNLANPQDGHMSRVVVSLFDADHHTETWVYIDHGKKMTEIYDLHRTKAAANRTKEGQK